MRLLDADGKRRHPLKRVNSWNGLLAGSRCGDHTVANLRIKRKQTHKWEPCHFQFTPKENLQLTRNQLQSWITLLKKDEHFEGNFSLVITFGWD